MIGLMKSIQENLDKRNKDAVDYVIDGVQRYANGVIVTFTVEWGKGRYQPTVAFFKDRGETYVDELVCD